MQNLMNNINNMSHMRTTGFIYDWALFRRDVRRDVRNCALYMFFFYGVYLTVAIVADDLLSGYPDIYDLGILSIASIVVGSLVFLIPRKRRFFTDIALPATERMTPKIFIVLIVVTQAIQLIYGIVMGVVDTLLPEGISILESYAEAFEEMVTPLSILYVVIVGPIFEELIFRGAVMGQLRKYGDNFAILFSSLFFGFYHAIIMQIPFAFVLGLLLGYAAARWSLRASIALHIIVNGFATLFVDSDNAELAIVGVLVMIVCVILAFVFLAIWNSTLKLRIRGSAAFYPHTYANGFSSVAFWLFIIVMTAFGVAQMQVVSLLELA